MTRPTTVLGASALLLAGAGLSACGGSSNSSAATPKVSPTSSTAKAAKSQSAATAAPAAAGPVAVTLSEFKIKPSVTSVGAGRIVFKVTNTGKMKHQFTVIHTKRSAATVLSKAKPNDDIPGAKGEISAILPGATRTLVIRDLKPGHYALVCALPGHYQAGMFADFNVT